MSFDEIFDLTAGVYFHFYNKIFDLTAGVYFNFYNYIPQRVPPVNTGFALYMYRQFMSSLCTKAQVCAGTGTGTGTDFRTGAGRFGEFGTSLPVPETSVSSVQHQYWYQRYRYMISYRCRTLR